MPKVEKTEIKVNLEELIETIVDLTVEHYVDNYEDGMRYNHRHIQDENIETMKASLVRKFVSIFREKKRVNRLCEK